MLSSQSYICIYSIILDICNSLPAPAAPGGLQGGQAAASRSCRLPAGGWGAGGQVDVGNCCTDLLVHQRELLALRVCNCCNAIGRSWPLQSLLVKNVQHFLNTLNRSVAPGTAPTQVVSSNSNSSLQMKTFYVRGKATVVTLANL